MRRLLCTISLLATVLYVTGCGFTADKIAQVAPTSSGKGMHGKVFGGQQPVVGSVVSVYAVGVGAPATLLASTVSDASGSFEFNTNGSNSYNCGSLLAVKSPVAPQARVSIHPQANKGSASGVTVEGTATMPARTQPAVLPDQDQTYVYITAIGGDSGGGPNSSIVLGAGLGKCIDAQSETVEINEVSTVVLANVMANFSGVATLSISSGSDPYEANLMEIALTNTFQTIDDLATGTVKPNTVSTSGGTSITIEAAKIYSLANIIASCVNSADDTSTTPATPSAACQTLFTTAGFADTPATDTYQAAVFICYAPFNNVAALYALAGPKAPFVGLPSAPNDWSVAISYSTTAMGFAIYESPIGGGSSSTIDLDTSSRVWFASNKNNAQGIGYFDPTENAFHGPYGGPGSGASNPLTLPQYVALDGMNQIAWSTDTLTGNFIGVDTTPGSEGNILSSHRFSDTFGGNGAVSNGPLLVNSDGSLVVSYDNSVGTPLQLTYDPLTNTIPGLSAFTLQPTGLTINTTQGTDPNDPSAPGVVAVSSNFSACDLEFSSENDGNMVYVHQTTVGCLSGGVATAEYDSVNKVQDQVAALATTNSFCSELLAKCASIPEYLSGPEGVAVDGNDEAWFANRNNASIFPLQITYGNTGTPDYSVVSNVAFVHDGANGNTMTQPVGIAVDRGGNIWVSNDDCLNTSDTTCSMILTEVFGTAYPTFTPLSLQAARLQGRLPPEGSTEGVGTPHSMVRRSAAKSHVSILNK